jgi:quinol monooxygenase YgiN
MIIVRIILDVLPEKQLEVRQTLLALVKSGGKEPGCLEYFVFGNIQDQNRFGLHQEWKTRDDLDQHIRSHRFGVLLGTRTLLSKPPSIKIHTVSQTQGIEAIHAVRNKSV